MSAKKPETEAEKELAKALYQLIPTKPGERGRFLEAMKKIMDERLLEAVEKLIVRKKP